MKSIVRLCDRCTYLWAILLAHQTFCFDSAYPIYLSLYRACLFTRSCQKYNQYLSLYDLIVHGVQRSSDARADESQENTTEVNVANEKATATKFCVDKEHEKETSIVEEACFSTGASDPVTLHNKANHQFPAKTRETKAWIESKGVGGDGSHERSKKESITSTEERRK